MRHGTQLALGVVTTLVFPALSFAAPAHAAQDTKKKGGDLEEESPAAAPAGAPPDAAGVDKADAPAAVPAPAPVPPPAFSPNTTLDGAPLPPNGVNWKTTIYGFAEFDVFRDSTQSYVDASSNSSIARPHAIQGNSVPGDNPRTQFTPRNSRIGIKLEATPYDGILATAQAEMDFYGNQAPTASEAAIYTNAPIRMRHFFLKLQDPIVDVLAGQYHDLFAWGGSGFFPNSLAFLAVFGEVYHRNPQLRLSKTVRTPVIDVEVAAAAVRPVGREDELPDVQAGLRFAVNAWKGVRAQGSGIPDAGPLALGLSAVGRKFRVNPFQQMVGDYKVANGWGLAANVVIPVIPCTSQDFSNAITITGEATMGTGISDLYPGLTGGARYPALPNPLLMVPPPVYNANIDPGILTFDSAGNVHTVNWRAVVAGLQYHLPIAMGKKVWVSGIYSMMQSTNLASITPDALHSTIWTKGTYYDANLFVALTPAVQVDASFQVTSQTYGDGLVAKNLREEIALQYFF
jgi:hypothetical protein